MSALSQTSLHHAAGAATHQQEGSLKSAVELTGLDDRGNSVNRNATTDANGVFAFFDLRPSNAAGYILHELQPNGYVDGLDSLGKVNEIVYSEGVSHGGSDCFSRLGPLFFTSLFSRLPFQSTGGTRYWRVQF